MRPECLECMYYDKINKRHYYYCWLISCPSYREKTWKEIGMRILKMTYLCFGIPMVCLAAPIDFIIWNLYIAPTRGYSRTSIRETIAENWEAYKEKIK